MTCPSCVLLECGVSLSARQLVEGKKAGITADDVWRRSVFHDSPCQLADVSGAQLTGRTGLGGCEMGSAVWGRSRW